MNFWADLNLTVFHSINGFAGRRGWFDRLMDQIANEDLGGLLIMAIFAALWFQPGVDQARRREILVVQIFAIGATIFVIRAIAIVLPFATRPMFQADIGFRAPMYNFIYGYENWSGFPSDTAGMMFSIASGFWLASKRLGLLFGVFSLAAMVGRIYFGIHFPVDIFIGALIGIIVTVTLNAAPVRRFLSQPILRYEPCKPALFYSLLFAILFETCQLFNTIREIGKAALQLIVYFAK